MTLKLSKNVREGMIVSIRGGKIIVCNKASRARGVLVNRRRFTIINMEGGRETFILPQGVQTHGPTYVIGSIS